jgi:fructose-bisphosphate aldolase, class I
MNLNTLTATIEAILADDRGLLAMDESTATCDKRFVPLGIPTTPASRRAWRDLIVTAPGLSRAIGGAILFDETIRQETLDGVPFAKALDDLGIVPGIKVDGGAKALALHSDEKVTEGLDGLRERLAKYAAMGARFAKWRAVITIGDGIPTAGCIDVNAHALARYAALCQEAGIVPIVEPEVVMDGDHSLARCAQVTERVLRTTFEHLVRQGVALEGMLLKPNMVLPGEASDEHPSDEKVAEATVNCFLRTVPAAVPGIAFLSGGQSERLASSRLNAMSRAFGSRMPWALTYSYSRAIQQPALELWRGDPARVAEAQRALVHRADCNRAARRGSYDVAADAPM